MIIQMAKPNSAPYPLGSHHRWVETLLLLVAPFLIAYILLCVILHYIGLSWILALFIAPVGLLPPCLALFWNGLTSPEEYLHVPWLSDIAVNLAYGTAEEDGIHFRKWIRHRFVRWRAIERLEYWPKSDGRISLHLYSQRAPIVFLPAQSHQNEISEGSGNESTTVEFISRKLNEAWPGKSTFVISYESPRVAKQGFLTEIMGRLSVRQRALANALLVLLSFICFYIYSAIRTEYHNYFWQVIAVLWAIALIAWIGARISRKAHRDSRERDGSREQLNSAETETNQQ
jgi:hypothetical protein